MPTLDGKIHTEDSLLQGFTFQEVIDTACANERVLDAATIKDTYENLVAVQMKDSKDYFNATITSLVAQAKKAKGN